MDLSVFAHHIRNYFNVYRCVSVLVYFVYIGLSNIKVQINNNSVPLSRPAGAEGGAAMRRHLTSQYHIRKIRVNSSNKICIEKRIYYD